MAIMPTALDHDLFDKQVISYASPEPITVPTLDEVFPVWPVIDKSGELWVYFDDATVAITGEAARHLPVR